MNKAGKEVKTGGRGETSQPTTEGKDKDHQKLGVGPWMVAQRPRCRQARVAKGNLGISNDYGSNRGVADNTESSKRSDRVLPRSSRGVKFTDSRAKDQGSRFNVLVDEMEVEADDKAEEEATNCEDAEDLQQRSHADIESQSEAVKEA